MVRKRDRSPTLPLGVYRKPYGYEIRVKRGGRVYFDKAPPDTSYAALELQRTRLLAHVLSTEPSAAPSGTLRRDVDRYLTLSKHLAGYGSQKAHLQAWVTALGDEPRATITRLDVLRVRGEWIAAGVKPKTCNNRVSALRALYHTLDGDDAPTPCDRVKPLPTHRTPAVKVPDALILAVDAQLQDHERRGLLRDRKTRARFRVRAATGRRPSEIMRAQPEDVDLKRRIWTPRDGKGGFTPGIYLTDDMIAAWALFIDAEAWGKFNTGSMAKVLRHCGWSPQVRPYNLRHTVGIALSEAGIDLADVQQMMGHKHQATTRTHYVPVLHSRLQKAAETLEGRLRWTTLPTHATHRAGESRIVGDLKGRNVPTRTRRTRAKVAKKPKKK
jgi:integrase